MGVASWQCVRPILMMLENSDSFSRSAPAGGRGRAATGAELGDRGDVHRRRKRVVRGLTHVDVVVRVDGILRADDAAEQLDGTVRDHLVDVHVGLRSTAGLEHDEREVLVERAGNHLVRRLTNRARDARVELARVGVVLRGAFFQHAKRADDRDRHARRRSADGKIDERSCRLRAVERGARHVELAKGVALLARGKPAARQHRTAADDGPHDALRAAACSATAVERRSLARPPAGLSRWVARALSGSLRMRIHADLCQFLESEMSSYGARAAARASTRRCC